MQLMMLIGLLTSAINDKNEVVGFFVLHRYYQHEGYDTPENVVYIRSLSINEKYQGFGYGTKIMMSLPQYVQGVFPDFNHLYLSSRCGK